MKIKTLLFCAALTLGATTASAQGTAPRVALETSEGRIVLELAPKEAPKSVDNFLAYVKAGHYDGTIFHRVIPTFMIQGGGFGPDMAERSTRPPIPIESKNGLKNARGTVAMARRGDPNSATAQFFINVVDNASLDYPSFDGHGYAVFGKVVEGMDVVDKIKAVPTGNRGRYQDVPLTPVTIKSARIVK
jgi:peptidyl-prolyl cis-trans isomerase A (cyclophilin A)